MPGFSKVKGDTMMHAGQGPVAATKTPTIIVFSFIGLVMQSPLYKRYVLISALWS